MYDLAQIENTKQLTLSLGSRNCTLTPDDLQKHPDSLLTKFACTIGDDISGSEALQITQLGSAVDVRSDSITIRLDKLPRYADIKTMSSWESFAFEVLPALYR